MPDSKSTSELAPPWITATASLMDFKKEKASIEGIKL
jgi:hypothetical protein